jgi:hypothetical protein
MLSSDDPNARHPVLLVVHYLDRPNVDLTFHDDVAADADFVDVAWPFAVRFVLGHSSMDTSNFLDYNTNHKSLLYYACTSSRAKCMWQRRIFTSIYYDKLRN